MTTWKLKSCPHCGGDIYLNHDIDNWSEECLQCGYQRELKEAAKDAEELSKVTIEESHR